MNISKKLFLVPFLGILGLALTQPVQADTLCTKTTKTVTTTTTTSPNMVERVVESPVVVDDSSCSTMSTPTTFDRVIENPVVIERPVMMESPTMVERNVMMSDPVFIKRHHHFINVGVYPIGGASLF